MDFWLRVKQEIRSQNTTQEWVAKKCKISFPTFRGWISRKIMPNADQAVFIAQVLGTTCEYLVAGIEPVHVAPRLRSIYDDLLILPDPDLDYIRICASGLAEKHRARESIEQETG